MEHILLFSIGPIQDFIASARRSRDLWFGSWMLSELGDGGGARENPIAEMAATTGG